MAEEVRVKNTGLRGITVADTKISFIDGEKGVLIYRGYRIEQLAENSSFMETSYLLLHGRLPTPAELADFTARTAELRETPESMWESMSSWPPSANPMHVLMAAAPMLAMEDPEPGAESREAAADKAMSLIARLPTITAGWHRMRNGLEPLPPDPSLDHAANFLYMLTGEKPDPQTARDFDVCLILHADHTFNASTFACREVVSTKADMYAGVTAGIGALSGSLHGGANAEVMKMLLELDKVDDLRAWVRERLDAGGKIMGLGHAVYKTGDPRGAVLKEIGRRLSEKTGLPWFDLTNRLEKYALEEFEARGKSGIQPNVDFRSAAVYYMMGIPIDIMTPIFAISRTAGWTSHIIEEMFAEAQGKPALYRPKAEYVGDYCGLVGCEYTPAEGRR